jgi:hypothetical protein
VEAATARRICPDRWPRKDALIVPFARIALVALSLAVAATGCGGSGSSASSVPQRGGSATATLQIRVPNAPAPSSTARTPQFIGAAVASVSVTMYLSSDTGHTTPVGSGTFNVASGSQLCTAVTGGRLCTLSIATVTGMQIATNAANTIQVAVGGIIASIVLTPTPQTLSATTASTYTLNVTAYDAASEVIIAGANTANNTGANPETDTYANPITIAVTETGGTGHTTLSIDGGENATSIQVLRSSSVVTVHYDGAAAFGYSASFAATATGATSGSATLLLSSQTPSIFVANGSGAAILGFPAITGCSPTNVCNLNEAPLSSLTTAPTPDALAIDSNGLLYVVNYYPSNTVSVYDSNETGSQAAIETITGINYPQFIALDGYGRIYVTSYANSETYVFPPVGLSCSTTAPCAVSTPLATMSFPGEYGTAVDGNGLIYLASHYTGIIGVFPAIPITCTTTSACTDSAPLATLGNGTTNLYFLVAVDAYNRIYAPIANGGGTAVYPAVSTSCTVTNPCILPTTPLATTAIDFGLMSFDTNQTLYTEASSANAVEAFAAVPTSCTTASPCTLSTTPIATISGSNTTLTNPFAVAVYTPTNYNISSRRRRR